MVRTFKRWSCYEKMGALERSTDPSTRSERCPVWEPKVKNRRRASQTTLVGILSMSPISKP